MGGAASPQSADSAQVVRNRPGPGSGWPGQVGAHRQRGLRLPRCDLEQIQWV